MTDDLEQFKEVFVSESKENLSALNATLLNLEKTPGDKGLLNEIFRVAHTLKGMAATMGYEKIAELSHEMENVLSDLKEGKAQPSAEVVDVLLDCFDALEVMVEEVATGGRERRGPYGTAGQP